MAERNDARRSIEASRTHLTEIAEELSRRTSGDYLKDRAREAAMARASRARDAAMSRASDMKERASASPAALGTIGALAGGTLGMALGKKAKNRRESESYYQYGGGFRTEGGSYVSRDYVSQPAYTPSPDYSASPEVGSTESWSEPWRASGADAGWSNVGYDREGYSSYGRTSEFPEESRSDRMKGKASEVKERAFEMKDRASEKASELKDRVSHKASDMKHRLDERRESHAQGPSLKQRASEWRAHMPAGGELRSRARENPTGAILGGLALGALAATLLPLTRKERRVMHPAKERARSQFGEQIHRVQERIGISGEEEQSPQRDWGAQSRNWQDNRGENWRGQDRGESWRAENWQGNEPGSSRGSFSSTSSTTGSTFSSSAGTPGSTYSTGGLGAPTSAEVGSRSGSTYGTATSNAGTSRSTESSNFGSSPSDRQVSSRDSLGVRSAADAPYRQPSFDQQLEEQNKDKDKGGKFH